MATTESRDVADKGKEGYRRKLSTKVIGDTQNSEERYARANWRPHGIERKPSTGLA